MNAATVKLNGAVERGEEYMPNGYHMVFAGMVIDGDKIWNSKHRFWGNADRFSVGFPVEIHIGICRKS